MDGVVGYHIRLTRERSPVRSWVQPLLLFPEFFCLPNTNPLQAPPAKLVQILSASMDVSANYKYEVRLATHVRMLPYEVIDPSLQMMVVLSSLVANMTYPEHAAILA